MQIYNKIISKTKLNKKRFTERGGEIMRMKKVDRRRGIDRRRGERRYIGGEKPVNYYEKRNGDRRIGERRKK